eukprot:c3660_g1_i1 orf=59-289(-)
MGAHYLANGIPSTPNLGMTSIYMLTSPNGPHVKQALVWPCMTSSCKRVMHKCKQTFEPTLATMYCTRASKMHRAIP